MRKTVFGLGLTQVAACALALGMGFWLMGQTVAASAVLGMALALSSTAVVMPVLAERGRLRGQVGRTAFAVLLAQDLAVAPILVTVSVLAGLAAAGGDAPDPAQMARALLALAPAAAGLLLLLLLGRLGLRPLFRLVVRARGRDGEGRELFIAACLLVVVGAGVAAQAAGLSMSIGALAAGLLLAETEFRREVEVSIEPFKGLLLGVFFISVGIGLDMDAVAERPAQILGLAAALTAVKALLIFVLARTWGLERRAALETALVLGPAGEFAFVVLATGMAEGVISSAAASTVTLAATISIFATPALAMIGQGVADRRQATGEPPPASLMQGDADHEVLIVGFGRVGRLIGDMLSEHGRRYVALDSDAATVAAARRRGLNVYYGDGAYADMLKRCGAGTARAVVVTMDAPTKVDEVVQTARALREDLVVIARARDDRHAARLYALGATDAVPETTEASLQLGENLLVDLGVPMGLVLASIHERRDAYRAVFQAAQPEERRRRPTRALRGGARPATTQDGEQSTSAKRP